MSGIILTFPILAGKVEAWRRFCQELYGFRRQPYEASRKRLAITCERMHELHGINLAGYETFVQPLSPPQNQELLFEWMLTSSVDG